QGSPPISAATRSASCPSTTTTGSSRAVTAARTARRITVSPPSSSSSLLRPIRLDVPAASTTPAMVSDAGMKRLLPLAQVARLPPRPDREQLRDHAQRHLLGPVGPQVQAHRREHPLAARHAQLGEDLAAARPRPEQA